MNATPLLRTLACVCLLLMAPGCALLSRPTPLTTLQLPPAPEALAWPKGLKPGRVTAASALKVDRVIVAEGARLMQHGGMRWVDVPAVMIAEYLRRIHARRRDIGRDEVVDSATLDLWITDFNLNLDPTGRLTVAVAAAGELRCTPFASPHPLAPTAATQALAREDADSVVAGFSAAVSEVVATVLASASSQAVFCATERAP